MAKLFSVSVEVTLYVVAQDSDGAAEWAENNADDWWTDVAPGSAYARELTRVPATRASDLPWIDSPDTVEGIHDAERRTIAQWVEAAKAGVTL